MRFADVSVSVGRRQKSAIFLLMMRTTKSGFLRGKNVLLPWPLICLTGIDGFRQALLAVI